MEPVRRVDRWRPNAPTSALVSGSPFATPRNTGDRLARAALDTGYALAQSRRRGNPKPAQSGRGRPEKVRPLTFSSSHPQPPPSRSFHRHGISTGRRQDRSPSGKIDRRDLSDGEHHRDCVRANIAGRMTPEASQRRLPKESSGLTRRCRFELSTHPLVPYWFPFPVSVEVSS